MPLLARLATRCLVADTQSGVHATEGSAGPHGHLIQFPVADLQLAHQLDLVGGEHAELDLGDLLRHRQHLHCLLLFTHHLQFNYRGVRTYNVILYTSCRNLTLSSFISQY